jgi:hypothetical protein
VCFVNLPLSTGSGLCAARARATPTSSCGWRRRAEAPRRVLPEAFDPFGQRLRAPAERRIARRFVSAPRLVAGHVLVEGADVDPQECALFRPAELFFTALHVGDIIAFACCFRDRAHAIGMPRQRRDIAAGDRGRMMAEDATPLIEALLEVIDAARLYLPGEIEKDVFVTRSRYWPSGNRRRARAEARATS